MGKRSRAMTPKAESRREARRTRSSSVGPTAATGASWIQRDAEMGTNAVRGLETDLQDRETMLSKTKKALKRAQRDLDEQQTQNQVLASQVRDFEQRAEVAASLAQQVEELQVKNARLQEAQANAPPAESAKAVRKREKALEKLRQQNASMASQLETCKAAEAQYHAVQEEAARLAGEHAVAEQHAKSLAHTVEQLKKERTAAVKKLEASNVQLRKAKEQHAAHAEQLAAMQRAAAEEGGSVDTMKQQLHAAGQASADMQRQLETLTEETEMLMREKAQATKRAEKIDAAHKKTKEQLGVLESKHTEMTAAITKTLQSVKEEGEKQLAAAQAAQEELRGAVEAAVREKQAAQKKADKAEKTAKKLKDNNSELCEQITHLSGRATAAEEQLAAASEELEVVQKGREEALGDAAAAKERVAELEAAAAAVDGEADERLTKLQVKLEETEYHRKCLQEENEKLEEEKELMEGNFESVTDETRKLQEDLVERGDELDVMRATLESQEAELSQMTALKEEVEALRKDLATSKEDFAKAKKDNAAKDRKNTALAKEVSEKARLVEQLGQERQDRDDRIRELEGKQSEVARLSASLQRESNQRRIRREGFAQEIDCGVSVAAEKKLAPVGDDLTCVDALDAASLNSGNSSQSLVEDPTSMDGTPYSHKTQSICGRSSVTSHMPARTPGARSNASHGHQSHARALFATPTNGMHHNEPIVTVTECVAGAPPVLDQQQQYTTEYSQQGSIWGEQPHTPKSLQAPAIYGQPVGMSEQQKYRQALDEQVMSNKRSRVRSRAQAQAESSYDGFFKFGSAGAGAPIRNAGGDVVSNVTYTRSTRCVPVDHPHSAKKRKL
eukprot:TRINITY_DN7300_c0_g1_i1.p1 TRINITY_DN7300_c0_g1~~TRINITY_DN7300_c0_g1_i1.p1  ORF type:complete len:846 (+),score=456.67 TRINITY_DN7300_c0_g1_i1:61-2598(+)